MPVGRTLIPRTNGCGSSEVVDSFCSERQTMTEPAEC